MRFAIPCQGAVVAGHVGTASHFTFLDANPRSGQILREEVVHVPSEMPAALSQWIADYGTDVVMASGLASRVRRGLAERGISMVSGVSGSDPKEIVREYLAHDQPVLA
jgi:predicted Fe-Mo cluster-binding NifX family protein